MPLDPGRRPIPARHFRLIRWAAGRMQAAGITPNGVSRFGLAAGVLSGALLGLTSVRPDWAPVLWILSAALVLTRGLSNVFDGLLAVEHQGATPDGLFWNEVPDRLSDIAVMAGAGYSLGGSPAAGWLCACLALLVTFIRVLSVLAGAPADFRGPFAKQQRMFSIAGLGVILALVPGLRELAWGPGGSWGLMAAWLWLMVPGIAWTGILRLRRAVRAVESPRA